MSFSALGLQPALLDAVAAAGYQNATPIQQASIPSILAGRDILAAAQTGTGKTASFVLPILQLLSSKPRQQPRPTRALILSPTRELAAQIDEQVQKYSQCMTPKLKHQVIYGGVSVNPQMMALRGGVDILTATPGRLLDLIAQNAVKINEVEILVLDEADRMLDMGFIRDIKKILAMLPKKRQNLLFSATFSNDIKDLTKGLLHDPVAVNVTPENSTVEKIEQKVFLVEKGQKTAVLIDLLQQEQWPQVLVFMATKHEANRLSEKLSLADIPAAAIHGNKSQNARMAALSGFKNGTVRVLVASDVAARGIDIAELPYVVNFTLPRSPADYVHRIGRTGRAGNSGLAVSLVYPDEVAQLKLVERLIGIKLPSEQRRASSNSINDKELSQRPPRPPRGKPRSETPEQKNGHSAAAKPVQATKAQPRAADMNQGATTHAGTGKSNSPAKPRGHSASRSAVTSTPRRQGANGNALAPDDKPREHKPREHKPREHKPGEHKPREHKPHAQRDNQARTPESRVASPQRSASQRTAPANAERKS